MSVTWPHLYGPHNEAIERRIRALAGSFLPKLLEMNAHEETKTVYLLSAGEMPTALRDAISNIAEKEGFGLKLFVA